MSDNTNVYILVVPKLFILVTPLHMRPLNMHLYQGKYTGRIDSTHEEGVSINKQTLLRKRVVCDVLQTRENGWNRKVESSLWILIPGSLSSLNSGSEREQDTEISKR